MSLITLNIDPSFLKRLLSCAERIADALERAYPPIVVRGETKPTQPDELIVFNAEKEWEREQEEEEKTLRETRI